MLKTTQPLCVRTYLLLSYLLFKVIQLNCLLVLFAGNLIRKIKGTKSEADEFFGFDDFNKVNVLVIFIILLGLFLLFIWWMTSKIPKPDRKVTSKNIIYSWLVSF